MNLDGLRRLKEDLEYRQNYCPAPTASDFAFEWAEKAAEGAQERLNELAPVFALLEGLDDVLARVERLERLTGHYEETDRTE